MALIRSITTIAGYTMLSRVLGFLRDVLIAAALGAGPVADAFFVALRIPNMFRSLVAEGAFTAAFVPMFSRRLETEDQSSAQNFAEAVLSVLLGTLLVFTLLAEITMPWLMGAMAPGFLNDPETFDLAVLFTRITFPYLLFMALVAIFGGILNALYRFAAAAAAPLLLNIVLIAAVLGFADTGPTPGHALAWGVALAGVGQCIWMAAACRRSGITLRLPRPRLTPDVRQLLRLMIPAGLTAGVYQINLLVGTIAATFEDGAVSYLYYADRVSQLPLGVVATAVGTALLPTLARALHADDPARVMSHQCRAIGITLLLTLPAAAALIIIAEPVITVLFERGAFGVEAVAATGAALAAFALGLPAYALVRVLAPCFFARENMATPLKISIAAMAANIALIAALFPSFGFIGIALATAGSSGLHASLLWWQLARRGLLVMDYRLRRRLPRMILAGACMAAGLWPAAQMLETALAGAAPSRIIALIALVVGGMVLFGLCCLLFGAVRFDELRGILRHRRSA